MTSIKLAAPAKVNIFLRVLNKRSDSYHNILTLFERISLSDSIKISKTASGIELYSDKAITKRPEDNLAYKAAELLIRKKRIKLGVKIEITKRIPIASGLGGGSSDAASVMTGMNKLFDLGLSKNELIRLGSLLGSDVPFFLFDSNLAIGTSRGEVLKNIGLKKVLWHLIIYPGNFKISAKDIYDTFDRLKSKDFTPKSGLLPKGLTRNSGDATISAPFYNHIDIDVLEPMLYNDLETVIAGKEKAVARTIECLASSLGKKAIVSGSGPSVFCLYRTRKEAIKAGNILASRSLVRKLKDRQVFIARTGI